MPLFIADAFTRWAGDFARREEDQHAGVLQVLLHLHQRCFCGSAAHIVHGDKQRAEGLKVRQHPVGDNLDVPAHARNGIQ